jgi:hypothetical protein
VTEALRLRAESADDLPTLSALVQDMVLKAGDVHYDAKARRLTLVGNRFRRESRQPSRVRSALRIDFLDGLQRRGWPASSDAILALLAIVTGDDAALELRFAGGTSLRGTAECIDITMEDLSGPWGTRREPDHES